MKVLVTIGGFILIVALVVFGGRYMFGTGGASDGDGNGGYEIERAVEKDVQIMVEEIDESIEEKSVITITVEDTTILLDEEECDGVEDLKSRISVLQSKGNNKIFSVKHDYAIKATYDEVKKMLTDLEETLGIEVDYGK